MRITDAILPGHTSASTMLNLSFLLLHAGSKSRPADTRENIFSLSRGDFNQQTEGLFILREHISTLVPLLPLGDHFLVNYFSLLKQMDPEASGRVQNSCTAIYNCLTTFFNSRHKGKLPLKLSLNF